MALPNFLIIGAMKAGTTSLYEDLRVMDGVYLPAEKEPEDLAYEQVETPEGLAQYERKFREAPPGDRIGEASTAYTKRPTFEGVAERAKRILGRDLKVIYILRDPVRRLVSHYHHVWGDGRENRPIDTAVLEDERFISYSRYSYQIEPWAQAFPQDQILVLRFEDYISDREKVLRTIQAFLGINSPIVAPEVHKNSGAARGVLRQDGIVKRFTKSAFYLYRIKPLLPGSARDLAKSLVARPPRALDQQLSPNTLLKIQEVLSQDALARGFMTPRDARQHDEKLP